MQEDKTTPDIPAQPPAPTIDVESAIAKGIELGVQQVLKAQAESSQAESSKKPSKSQAETIRQEEDLETQEKARVKQAEDNHASYTKVTTTIDGMGGFYSKLVANYKDTSLNITDKTSELLAEACFEFFKKTENKAFIPSLYVDKVYCFLSLDRYSRVGEANKMYYTLVLSLDKIDIMKKQQNRANLSLHGNDNDSKTYANKFMKRRQKLTSINYTDNYKMEAN